MDKLWRGQCVPRIDLPISLGAVALVFAVSLRIFFDSGYAATPRTLVGKVERVTDGDTITAFTSEGTKLRLLGIDAPEVPH